MIRSQVRIRVGRYWLRTDVAAAKAWLEESEFPEHTLSEIFKKRNAVEESPKRKRKKREPGDKPKRRPFGPRPKG